MIRSALTLALLAAMTVTAAAGSPAPAANRVVTLSPNLAQLVCDAGGCNKLVGVSAYTANLPQTARLPRIGGAWGINYEAILGLHPDLILAWHTGTPVARIDKLRRLGLKVRVVTTHSLQDIATALEQIGGWLGTEKTATRTATHYREQLALLQKRHADANPVRVFFQIGTRPVYTINDESPISAALAVCGGTNVFADLPRIAEPVSAEAILAARPEVVLYGRDISRAEIDAFWSRLSRVPARTEDHIFAVNIGNLTGTPQIIDGIRHVCRLLDRVRSGHPRGMRVR